MKQTIIFAFLVLVTLSMVNAVPHGLRLDKRETKFLECPKGAHLNVKVSPDPPVSGQNGIFDVSGKPNEAVPQGSEIVIVFVDTDSSPENPDFIGEPFVAQLCDDQDAKCPIESGKSFSKKVAVRNPDNLPNSYLMVVIVSDPLKKVLGCAYSVVGDNLVPQSSQLVLSSLKF
jgi:hypothetical protein